MIDVNPAKVGVDNPVRRREQRPFESWADLEALVVAIGPRYGPMILFAAATGLRPAEWIALEKRDIDREERVVYVRRSFTRRELKHPVSRRAERLPRHPPFPPLPMAARPEGRGHRPVAAGLRSPAHLRDLRA